MFPILTHVCSQLQDGYKGGIQYTTNQFKLAAPIYVIQDARTTMPSIRLLPADHKSHRGFNNNELARALVPFQHRAEYDGDPGYVPINFTSLASASTSRCSAFRAKVNNGDIVISASDLPSMLFSDDLEYDPEDPASCLGSGHIFLRVRACPPCSPSLTVARSSSITSSSGPRAPTATSQKERSLRRPSCGR